LAWFGVTAVLCVLVGVIISSNLNLPTSSVAQSRQSTNISQTGSMPVVERDGNLESPFVSVVERLQNAVVNISSRSRGEEVPWWAHPAITQTSSGSGFFFREDGYILTNSHVVKEADEVTVRTATGYEYPATLVGLDTQTDLAVLKVTPEEKIVVIPFGNSDEIKVGDWAIAIGNPFPQQGLDRSVTVGVISAIGRSNLRFGRETPRYQNYIQTDAAINPGNSGGPLINLKGECVGVNAAISSPTGSSVGIGFAIPINLARAIVPDLIATGQVKRGWLGVWLADVTERDAKRLGLDAVRGVRIDSVFTGSPPDQAGIREGDIVMSFNNQEVLNTSQFMVLVSTIKTSEAVPLTVLRDGKRLDLATKIGDQEAFFASSERSGSGRRSGAGQNSRQWQGMELVTFTPDIAIDIAMEHVPGVYVTSVAVGSPADKASISEGTIIMQINNREVSSVDELLEVAAGLSGSGRKIPLIVLEPDGSLARKVLRT
jgi:serine protease Do